MHYPQLLDPSTNEPIVIFQRAFDIHKTGQTITDDNGYQNLTFKLYYGDPKFDEVINEMDIECDEDVYTIKKIERDRSSNDVALITCDALWYRLADGEYKEHNSSAYFTALLAVQEQLEGTGWTIDSCDITITHAYTLESNSVLANLRAIRDLYGGEMWFDTKNKKVLYGQCLGVKTDNVFSYRKNLSGIKKTVDTTELYTRFTLVGAEGVTLAAQEGKLAYVEDYSYYDNAGLPRVLRHYTKTDERFTNAYNMEEYMLAWIAVNAQPKVTYEITAACVNTIPGVGDYIYIIDADMNIKGWMKVTEMDVDVLDQTNSRITLNSTLLELSDALAQAETSINNAVNVTMSGYTTKEELTSAIAQTESSVKIYAKDTAITESQAAANAAVGALQIGGTNLYLGTRDFSGDLWTNSSYWTLLTDEMYEDLSIAQCNVRYGGLAQELDVTKVGDKYTISCYAKGDGVATARFIATTSTYFQEYTPEVVDLGVLPATWGRYSATFEVANAATSIMPRIELTVAGTIQVAGIKVELGDKATGWSPAPSDVFSEISNVQADTINTVESSLEVLTDQIKLEVAETYATIADTESIANMVSSSATLASEEIQLAFERAVGYCDDKTGAIEELTESIKTWFSFTEDGMQIGKSDSDFTVMITNESIKFYSGSTELGYFLNNRLYIPYSIEVGSVITIGDSTLGKWSWEVGENGHFRLRSGD